MKERGNVQFNRKSYMHAIKIFSQAIQLFRNADCPMGHQGIKTKITQIYTNRATSFHMVNE